MPNQIPSWTIQWHNLALHLSYLATVVLALTHELTIGFIKFTYFNYRFATKPLIEKLQNINRSSTTSQQEDKT